MSDIEANVQSTRKVQQYSIFNLILRLIFHGCCVLGFLFVSASGFKIWFTISEADMREQVLKDLKILTPFFFTNWNFAFQTVFLGLSLAHDVLEWLDKHGSSFAAKIGYWRNVIFSGMVVPFTLFVTSMFWCVYAIDRELVFPRIYDQVVPWWFNHCVHTNITIVVIIETLLQARRKPTDQRLELTLYWAVALIYAVVYYTIYFFTGRWLYQIFGVLNWWQVCLYQIGIWLVTYIFYRIQFPINRLFHGSDDNEINIESTEDTEDSAIEDKVNENDAKTNEANAIENSQIINDLNTSPLPKKTWSLKFRSIKSHFENSRL